MPRFSSASTVLWAFMVLGCTQVVAVEDYTFDLDPCGPRPTACSGGSDREFVIVGIDTPPLVAEGQRDGFDLDGTSDPICGRPDQVGPTTGPGVDNEAAGMLELGELGFMVDLYSEARLGYLRGEDITLLFLSNYDGPDDDCVQVTYRRGRVPAGTPLQMLDVDEDGELDPDGTYDYGAAYLRDATACVIDGVIHARFASGQIPLAGVPVQADRLRMSIPVRSSTRIEGALLGGALPVEELSAVLPPEVVEFVRPRADIAPSARDARDCTEVSFALALEAVPARRGVPF